MKRLPTRPFFIVGHPRSGTTLLRVMVSSHPRLHIPGETGFLPFLSAPPDGALSPTTVARLLQQIGRLNRGWRDLVAEPGSFYKGLPVGPGEPALGQVLDALYRRKLGGEHGRWGDKTPSYVAYIPEIEEIFPTAQFIQIVRDGRDAMLSARAKWAGTQAHLDSYYLLRRWVENVERGREAGRRLGPERYFELRYEDLVAEPERVLRGVCRFLDEPFHPAMLDHTAQARAVIAPQGHSEVRQPLSTESVGRWRREMDGFERRLADHIAGPTLQASGYELAEAGPWEPGERRRLLLRGARYRLLQSARRVGYATGLLTLNRGKRA